MKIFLFFLLLSTVICMSLGNCDSYPGVYERASKLYPSETIEVLDAFSNLNSEKFFNLMNMNLTKMNSEDLIRIQCGIHKALMS